MSWGRFDQSRSESGDRDFIRILRPRPHTAVIVMDRPERMNSMAFEQVIPLHAAIEELAHDNDIGCVVLTGTGDVLEPEDGMIAIGSGGNFALAAARALIDMEGHHHVAVPLGRITGGYRQHAGA